MDFATFVSNAGLDVKPYQEAGVNWGLGRETKNGSKGGILADEMGTGKTINIIGLIVCNPLPRTLIIVPPSLLKQWQSELRKYAPLLSVVVYHGSKKPYVTELLQSNVTIATYNALSIVVNRLHAVVWDRIVFDEAHNMRNCKTAKYMSAIRLCKMQDMWLRFKMALPYISNDISVYYNPNCIFDSNYDVYNSIPIEERKKRDALIMAAIKSAPIDLKHVHVVKWCVTGTPIQNSTNDFESLCSILEVSAPTATPGNTYDFIMRRTKLDVGLILPPLTEEVILLPNTNHTQLTKQLHQRLTFVTGRTPRAIPTGSTLAAICYAQMAMVVPNTFIKNKKVKQLCSPNYVLNADACMNNRLCMIVRHIAYNHRLAAAAGPGIVIFYKYTNEIENIAYALSKEGITDVAVYNGSCSQKERDKVLSIKHSVLMVQIVCGSDGLNLQQHYSEIYFTSVVWNPMAEKQAIARCHRIGQTKPVHVYRFKTGDVILDEDDNVYQPLEKEDAECTTDTLRVLEKHMYDVQECKLGLADELMSHTQCIL